MALGVHRCAVASPSARFCSDSAYNPDPALATISTLFLTSIERPHLEGFGIRAQTALENYTLAGSEFRYKIHLSPRARPAKVAPDAPWVADERKVQGWR